MLLAISEDWDKSFPIPTTWDPCPGNKAATLSMLVHSPNYISGDAHIFQEIPSNSRYMWFSPKDQELKTRSRIIQYISENWLKLSHFKVDNH
jgi:hypothetical protein